MTDKLDAQQPAKPQQAAGRMEKVAKKMYCDLCGKEMSCTGGNDYIASHKNVGGEEWQVKVCIYRHHSSALADLCADCVTSLAKEAFSSLQQS